MSYIDILEMNRANPELTTKIVSSELLPLYQQYWQEKGKVVVNKDFEPHIQSLIELWANGALKVFIARTDDDDLTGFALCMIYRPIQYKALILQVQDLYSTEGHPGYDMFYTYLNNVCKLMGCDEILFNKRAGCPTASSFGKMWANAQEETYYRLVRKE